MLNILSLVIAVAYLIAAYIIVHSVSFVFITAVVLLIPLWMIWSPEGLGHYKFWDHVRTSDESDSMIKLAGWLFLLMPLLSKIVQLLVK